MGGEQSLRSWSRRALAVIGYLLLENAGIFKAVPRRQLDGSARTRRRQTRRHNAQVGDVPLMGPGGFGTSVFACLVARLQLLTNFLGESPGARRGTRQTRHWRWLSRR